MQLEETHTTWEQSAMDQGIGPRDDADLTCRALRVALCAVQLHIAWHSGTIGGDAAMATLEREIHRATTIR